MSETLTLDQQKIEALAFRVVGDMGGAAVMGLAYIGDKLGLFKALAGSGPVSSDDLAGKTGLNERYVREWLKAMVAAEYIDYEQATGKYVMSPEQAAVLVNEDFPFFVGGAFQMTAPSLLHVPRVMESFQKGGGVSYEEMGPEIPEAIERFFRPGYVNFLVQEWLPAVPGLVEKLRQGGRVLDVGCGRGQSTVYMAKGFPRAKVVGADNHGPSIERARQLAEEAGVNNVEFRQVSAADPPTGEKYDLICAFDCIHDMTDPRGALKAIRESLADDGVFVWLEPNASAKPLENRNPVGKLFTAISPLHCMTVSLAHGGEGLGTVIGEDGVQQLGKEAGFSKIERLPIENPFNAFYALRR